MKALIVAASAGFVIAAACAVPANALSGVPAAASVDSKIVPVSGGCGPRGFRNRFGFCVYPRRYRY
jgi:hypothetical protein